MLLNKFHMQVSVTFALPKIAQKNQLVSRQHHGKHAKSAKLEQKRPICQVHTVIIIHVRTLCQVGKGSSLPVRTYYISNGTNCGQKR